MMTLLAILALVGEPDTDALPLTMSLQDDDGPNGPRRLEPVERPAEPDAPEGFTVDFVFQLRSIGGSTKVRENASLPARLNLANDLGMGNAGGGRLAFRWDTENLQWFLEMELYQSSGSGSFPANFSYDEGAFHGEVPYTSSMTAFFGRAGVAFKSLIPPTSSGIRLSPFVGVEYPRMSVGINQPLANETSSEQYEQFVPYPILGLVATIPLDPSLTINARAFGTRIPTMPTPFTEGGRLSMEITSLNAEATITWRLSSLIRLSAGVGYQYWHGTITSKEDGNDLKIQAPYVELGLELRW